MSIVFDRTVLYMCIENHIQVNVFCVTVSTQGIDELAINVYYY